MSGRSSELLGTSGRLGRVSSVVATRGRLAELDSLYEESRSARASSNWSDGKMMLRTFRPSAFQRVRWNESHSLPLPEMARHRTSANASPRTAMVSTVDDSARVLRLSLIHI